jgi:hypothetical protein
MTRYATWRGEPGGLVPEDRARVDRAIETSENLDTVIGDVEAARDVAGDHAEEAGQQADIALDAVVITRAQADGAEASAMLADELAEAAALSAQAADQQRQAAEAAAQLIGAVPYATRADLLAAPGTINAKGYVYNDATRSHSGLYFWNVTQWTKDPLDLDSRLAALETVTIDAFAHGSGTRELGTSVSPVLSWSLSRTDIVTSLTINGVAVDPEAGSYTAPEITASQTYVMVATDASGRTVSRNTAVTFRAPMFYGASPAATLADAALNALDPTPVLAASRGLSVDVPAADGDFIWVVYPLSLGAQTGFRMAGLSVTPVVLDRTVTTPNGHTASYRFLRSPVAVSAGLVPVEVL